MKTLNVMLSNLGGRVVPIGYEGENLYTRVRINCIEVFADYPDATVSMVVNPPDGNMYPAIIEKSGVMVIWDISDAVLSSNGSGECQLTFTDGDVVRKSVVFGISINRSLIASGDPPEPVQEWIDKADQTAQEIAENAANLAKEDIVESYGSIAPAIIETASGAIASFSDGADGMLVKTLTVDIDPVQDLHGYDNPWPAGGGVNKCPSPLQTTTTISGITFTCDGKGECSLSGTASSGAVFALLIDEVVLPSTVYVHLFNSNYYSENTPVIDFMNGSTTVDFVGINVTQNRIYNGTSDMGGKTINGIRIRVPSGFTGSVTFKIYISDSDAVVDFSPYSNICPISGWDSANVSRTGKNLLDITDVEFEGWYNTDGTKELSNSYNCYLVSVKPETTYTISGNFAGIITYWDSGLNFISGTNQGSGASKTFTTPSNCAYIRRSILKTNIDGTQMLELGSTATTYEAFSGSTIEYAFPQAAGTVYGATLTIHQDGSGALVVNEIGIDGGDLNWSKVTGSNYRSFKTNLNPAGHYENYIPTIRSSIYKSECNYTASVSDDNYVWIDTSTTFAVKDVSKASLTSTEFKDAMSGVQFVYELATPVTYQLTNQQVVSMLKGTNNVWADTGNVSLEYPADTKMYIDARVAELQALILENISNS